MGKDYALQPYDDVRRKDREVIDEGWIKALLHQAPVGLVATAYEEQPFITPLLYVYDEAAHAIYCHTAKVGRMRANVDLNARACFNVNEIGRLLPADEALEFSNEYASVTVFGPISLVEDQEAQRHALQLLLDKYAPHLRAGRDYRPITDEELAQTAVFQLDIELWSGKKKEEAADFPGAYTYGDFPSPDRPS
jgi:nitroimidazol reductase NimA-like FMN-containing flavoprotein (pyridoxamine 5'-phosphate oxidase superfamily)